MHILQITAVLGLLAPTIAAASPSHAKGQLDNYLLIEQAVIDYANEATLEELHDAIGGRADIVIAARPFHNAQALRRVHLQSTDVDKLGRAAKQAWVPDLEAALPPSATTPTEPEELPGLSPGVIHLGSCHLQVIKSVLANNDDHEQDIATLTYSDRVEGLFLSQRDGRPVVTRRDANGTKLGAQELESTTLLEGETEEDHVQVLNFPTLRLALLGRRGFAVIDGMTLDVTLLDLEFKGLGIFKFADASGESNDDKHDVVSVETCDEILIKEWI